MARSYKVSADTSEKEKIIGGILTIGQGGWIVLGILIAGVIFLLFQLVLPPLPALFLGVLPGGLFIWRFAFSLREDLPYATYLLYRSRFRKKTRHLINTLTYGKDFRNQPPLF